MTDWPVWILALIEVLAVHRLARLVTADTITVRPRRAVILWSYVRAGFDHELIAGDGSGSNPMEQMVEADEVEDPCGVPKLAVLVTCRWCASVWLAGGVVLLHGLIPAVWLPVAAVLALSSSSTLLAAIED